ncbi:dormancy-associated protein homolog 3-like isoform X3 [Rhododendron vialii]|uniref:dormancy-associated protein homolog 3-like isoform X3 n=1 Tax=Rhododendron vialii TaxID=182163 RepID=UPI00265F2269|nr:dormancy-associated protein homolog 3-like isoform X3 [Rhododendron vialii]
MSLLDQLWDDTIAGPRPDKGLGKLRKQPTFTLRALSSGKESDGGSVEEGVRVTRSIMIVKPPGVTQNDSPPVSPAGSTTPVSPFSDPVPIPALIVDGDIQVNVGKLYNISLLFQF